ncbi:DUF2231 domain-containing protein [Micromonospora sp. NPDC047738]|uniref:DUF2231 domain-containing protein n=1 Tax=Micromonospora sp. NPDC047738 TaxID=3155741 RepID=UPI0033E375FB
MESRLKVLGHPVHPMLVMFPVALLVTALIFDVLALPTGARAKRVGLAHAGATEADPNVPSSLRPSTPERIGDMR